MDRQRAREPGSIVWLLAFLGLAARRRVDATLAKHDLTPPEAMLLRSAARTEGATVLGLAEGCGLGGSTVVGALDRLEEAGLAQRERDREDRRVVRVRLTDRGRQTAEALPALVAALEGELTDGFSAAEREVLRGHLLRVAETLKARSPELLEKLRAERMLEWKRGHGAAAKRRARRTSR